MNRDSIRLRRLGLNERVARFDCGDADLNDFILSDAVLYYRVRLSTSYVLENADNGDVMGYFSLAHDRISLTDFPSSSAYNRFRKSYFSRGKQLRSYPALKVCRLATDLKYRGNGVGTLIMDTIITSYKEDNRAGCRFITVDAYQDAIPFYSKLGFVPLSNEDKDTTTRLLYFDLESIKS